jgi:hypothetical protein
MLQSFSKNNFQITAYETPETSYFKAREIATLLGYKYPANAIQDNVEHEDKITIQQLRLKGVQIPTKIHKQTIFINERGVRTLVVKSTLPNAKNIAEELGIDILGSKILRKEADSICEIMKAFNGQNMMLQYSVLTYRVDLYFPDYNICVECDENGHSDRDPNAELQRYLDITKNLNCQWYRYNPDSKDYDIMKVVNGIFRLIINSKK